MTQGVNQVTLIGRVGDYPKAASNGQIANFSIATSERWIDKKSGQTVQHTEWHRIVCFNKTAEIAINYVAKGNLVYIQGKLKTETWTNRDNISQTTTKVIASRIEILTPSQKQQTPTEDNQSYTRPVTQQSSPPQLSSASHAIENPMPPRPDEFDDDIPF